MYIVIGKHFHHSILVILYGFSLESIVKYLEIDISRDKSKLAIL